MSIVGSIKLIFRNIAVIIVEANAIETDRLLLTEPDPTEKLVQETVSILKNDVNELKTRYIQKYDERMDDLRNNHHFKLLTPEQKHAILVNNQILIKPELKDHDAKGLKTSLSKVSLDGWQTKISALVSQFDNAVGEAVKLLEPKAKSYSLPRKTLSSQNDIDNYLNELKTQLEDVLKNAKSIILK